MSDALMTVTLGKHDFPAATQPGGYRCSLSQPGSPPLVKMVPYPVGAVGAVTPLDPPPISATFQSVPVGMYTGDCSLIDPNGVVLWSAPSVPVQVDPPPADAVTLMVPVSINVTITFTPPAAG